jgi:hypothetical protein
VRIAALLGILAIVLGGGAMMMLGGGGSEPEAVAPTVIKHHPFGAGATTAKPTPTAAKPSPTAKPKPTPAAKPAHRAPVQSAAVTAALKAGLPPAIARALGAHPVVVVSVFDPYSEVDGISFAEARAGAKLAHAGFVPLNVLSEAQAGKLTEQLGLLPNPGLLVYARPSTLAVRINGFVDKETVAQAAANAALQAR